MRAREGGYAASKAPLPRVLTGQATWPGALRAAPSWLVTVGKERCIFNRAVQIFIITATDSST